MLVILCKFKSRKTSLFLSPKTIGVFLPFSKNRIFIFLSLISNISELKEIFNLYDEELDGKIDGTQIGDVVRAAGLKPTNLMVTKAAGAEYKRKGEKRITFEEWLPIYDQLSKEKVNYRILFLML